MTNEVKIRELRFREGRLVTLMGNEGYQPVNATPIGAPYMISVTTGSRDISETEYQQRKKSAILGSIPEGADSYMKGEKENPMFCGCGYVVSTAIQAYKIKD